MPRSCDRSSGWHELTFVVAACAAVAAGMRREIVVPGLTPGLIFAIVSAPLWGPGLLRIGRARLILLLTGGAVMWGVMVLVSSHENAVSRYNLTFQILTALALSVTACLLVWAIDVLGAPSTVLLFGLGSAAHVVLNGANPVNPWKYSWSLPVALILLGLAMLAGSRWWEIIALVVVAGVSATSDSRSMTAFLMLTAGVAFFQLARQGGRALNRAALVVALAAAGLGGYNLFQALVLEGVLGADAAQRTQAQLDATGSLLTGGRPELGASRALIEARPEGFGPGAVPTANDVWLAKTGMSTLNYDPNNGYVEVFMFGGRFELHSMIGDFWVWFGPLGALLIVVMVATAVHATVGAIAANRASAALTLLTVLGLWNAAFSPVQTSFHLMSLVWALTVSLASPRRDSARGAEAVEADAGRGNGRD